MTRSPLLLCLFLVSQLVLAQDTLPPTESQQQWLQDHQPVRRTADATWPPFEFKDGNGDYVGMCMDYFNLIRDRLDLQIDFIADLSWTQALQAVKQRKLDMISCLDKTAKREDFMVFSKPFTSIPQIIVTRTDAPYISGLKDLNHKKVAMIKDYVVTGILQRQYPALQPLSVESALDGLNSVAVGQADAFVGSLAVSVYLIERSHLANLKIAAPAEVAPLHLRFAFRNDWPQMATIFDAIIDTMTPQEHTAIHQRWISVDYDSIIDTATLWKVGGGLGVLLLFSTLWLRQVQAQKKAVLISETRLRAVIDNATEGIININEGGIIEAFNPAASDIFGYTPDEVLGLNIDILMPQPFHHEHHQHIKSYLQTGVAKIIGKNREVLGKKKDGAIFPMELSVTEFKISQQRLFTGIMRDISKRKAAQQALLEARDAAEAASRAKASFLANMSHEIRTPMNAIMGLTHLTLQTELTRKQHDYLSKIQHSADALLGVINDILDISKIEAGKLKMDRIDFQLDQVLTQLADVISVKAAEKDLEFLFYVAEDVPNGLVGDPLRLGQILINFCTNAVKFTARGEVLVSVKQLASTADTCHLQFSVTDSGIGITPEQHEKLFKSFSQADASTTRKYGGTGLGLSICKQIVELMGGEIGVDSVPDQGSTFYFSAEFQLQSNTTQRVLKHSGDSRGMRVLVVDDSATASEVLAKMLQSLAFKVCTVASGDAALHELIDAAKQRTEPYDVVLMDWKMPGMDGIETTRRIQTLGELKNTPKIIMVTAYDQDDVREQAKHVHLDGLLTKPVNPSLLFDTLMHSKTDIADDTPISAATTSGPKQIEASRKLKGQRLLLVEDNAINQLIAQQILENAGFLVDVADNGKLALACYQQHGKDYAAILMDLQMPEMDGFAATRALRTQNKTIPIIAMTAHTMDEERQRCLDAGMNDHVAKPIGPERLFAVLLSCIELPEPTVAQAVPTMTKQHNRELLPANLPGFDLQSGLNRVGGDSTLYKKLLLSFYTENQQVTERVKQALAQHDFAAARQIVHAIKGVSGNLSARQLFNTAKQLETALQQENEQQLPMLLTTFAGNVDAVMRSLSTLRNLEKPKAVVNTTDVPIDLERISTLIHDLDELLGEFNMKAEPCYQLLAVQLAQPDFVEPMRQLETAINHLEFDAAREILDELANTLKITL